LTSYLTEDYCLGSSERPYVDGGQTEMCIAFWKRSEQIEMFNDIRALYFRYVTNDRLPGQMNKYYSWYGGADRFYSPNLLHQDGRQHVLQYKGKAILLSQPVKRENGHLQSLRFDALLPVYEPVDEIWVGEQKITSLPVRFPWDQPVTIRDGSVYLALRSLQPTDLGNSTPAVELSEVNHHLILSIYNLRGSDPHFFPAYMLDHTHNGLIFEIGTASEHGDFASFRKHIAEAEVSEQLRLEEIREVRYRSGPDTLRLVYHPGTQETLAGEINGQTTRPSGFECQDAVQRSEGRLTVGGVSLFSDPGVPAWLACKKGTGWVTAVLPTDQPTKMRLETPAGAVECASFAAGRIRIHTKEPVEIELVSVDQKAPVYFSGFKRIHQVLRSGQDIQLKQISTTNP
jgi:hypothetical protein